VFNNVLNLIFNLPFLRFVIFFSKNICIIKKIILILHPKRKRNFSKATAKLIKNFGIAKEN